MLLNRVTPESPNSELTYAAHFYLIFFRRKGILISFDCYNVKAAMG